MVKAVSTAFRKQPRNATGYARDAILTYKNDPPDTDFQRGYLAALLACWDFATEGMQRKHIDIEAIRERDFPNRVKPIK